MPDPSDSTADRLRHCVELEYILLGDLRDLLDDELNEQTKGWLLAVLDVLLKTLPEQYELKAQDGYLGEVLDAFPNWERVVDNLENQQMALVGSLSQLREQIFRCDSIEPMVNQLQTQLGEWIEAFQRHQREERDLFQLAVNLQTGGGD